MRDSRKALGRWVIARATAVSDSNWIEVLSTFMKCSDLLVRVFRRHRRGVRRA